MSSRLHQRAAVCSNKQLSEVMSSYLLRTATAVMSKAICSNKQPSAATNSRLQQQTANKQQTSKETAT
jgi:hypothetical protein